MAHRANWKGYLKLGLVSCPVALYTAASQAERVSFNTVNRRTGHRLHRIFVDPETEETVERDQQVKGYEVASGQYIMLEQEEINATVPESTKTLEIDSFVPFNDIDSLYLDSPYYLAPVDRAAQEAFAVIRAAMAAENVVGLARTVLFRRERAVLLVPRDRGMVGVTLHVNAEIRDTAAAFRDIPKLDLADEMIDLAQHIISTKRGHFDPESFEDRYEDAVVALVRAKQAGRKPPALKPPPRSSKVVDLLDALRRSAGVPEGKQAGEKKAGGQASTAKSGKTAAAAKGSKAAKGAKAKTPKTAARKPRRASAPQRKAG